MDWVGFLLYAILAVVSYEIGVKNGREDERGRQNRMRKLRFERRYPTSEGRTDE